jgi:protein SCO1/2
MRNRTHLTTRSSLKPAVIGLAMLGLFAAAAPSHASLSELDPLDRVRIVEPPKAINNAELTDANSKPFKLSDLNGRVALIFFGFTHCPDVCPLAMQRMRLLDESGAFKNTELAYVMIGIDPERDTPEAMQEFLQQFSKEFIGLSGDKRTLKKITRNFSASFFKDNSNKDGDYSVSHSPQTFVLDQQGQLRAEFYDAPVDTMTTVIRALLDKK